MLRDPRVGLPHQRTELAVKLAAVDRAAAYGPPVGKGIKAGEVHAHCDVKAGGAGQMSRSRRCLRGAAPRRMKWAQLGKDKEGIRVVYPAC